MPCTGNGPTRADLSVIGFAPWVRFPLEKNVVGCLWSKAEGIAFQPLLASNGQLVISLKAYDLVLPCGRLGIITFVKKMQKSASSKDLQKAQQASTGPGTVEFSFGS